MILPQTQEVMRCLKEAGAKRGEFRVRCQRLMRGKIFIGFGDVHILPLCSLARQRELAPTLARYFHVTQFQKEGNPLGSLLIKEGNPGLFFYEV